VALIEWVIDTSALARLAVSPDRDTWGDRIQRSLVRWTTVTRLEMGLSARSAADLRGRQTRLPYALLAVEHLTPAVEERAVEVQALLGDAGHHRAPSVADLLVAAVAELSALTVLHVDKDFELIAGVTGQPTERLRLPDRSEATPT